MSIVFANVPRTSSIEAVSLIGTQTSIAGNVPLSYSGMPSSLNTICPARYGCAFNAAYTASRRRLISVLSGNVNSTGFW